MADKTIPSLPTISQLENHSLFPVDSGIETFKVSMSTMALFVRESIIPAGVVIPFAGSFAPDGWLLAYGQQVSRSTYSKLFASIGTTYGVGDGSTTFNLPDLRGRVPAGRDNMGGSSANRLTTGGGSGIDGSTLGAVGGSQTYTPAGTIGGSQSIAHTHNIAHCHQWSYYSAATGGLHTISFASNSASEWTTNQVTLLKAQLMPEGDGVDFIWNILAGAIMSSVVDSPGYTSGALQPPSGSLGSATSGGMSTNTNVNGSNFSFTGSTAANVQPSIVMNYIIKT